MAAACSSGATQRRSKSTRQSHWRAPGRLEKTQSASWRTAPTRPWRKKRRKQDHTDTATFLAIADEYVTKLKREGRAGPGSMPINSIDAPAALKVLAADASPASSPAARRTPKCRASQKMDRRLKRKFAAATFLLASAIGDRKPWRLLSEDLEPWSRWGRGSDPNCPRWPDHGLAGAFGRPFDLHEAAEPAVTAIEGLSRGAGLRRQPR